MALEAARRYLERVVAWDGVGYNGIFYKFLPPGAEKPIIPGNAFQTVDAALAHLAKKQKWGGDTDIWLSMASQPNVSEKKSNAVRFQNSATCIKSLFIDLDVKPGKPDKGYETTEDALAAFDAFVAWCGLPDPNVKVLSGTGGAHVYWTLDTPLTPAEWQPWANALAAAAIAFGLKFDSQCTVDVVRLLRIPDTFNGKQTPRLPVVATLIADWDYSIDHLSPALEPFLGRIGVTKAGEVTSVGNVNDELSGGIEARTATPRDIDVVAAKCGFIANTLATGGAAHSNPLWYLSLATAIYCDGGEAVAHRLSSSHSGYHPDETRQEYERIKADHANRASLGFPSCGAIEASGGVECATCPMKGHIKSPLNIVATVQPTATAPTQTGVSVPAPYFVNPKDDRVYVSVEDGARSEVVLDFHISNAWSSNNGGMSLHFQAKNAFGVWRQCSVEAVAMSTAPKLHEAFAHNHMSVLVTDKVRAFMVSFLAHLQKSKASILDATPFGWTETNSVIDGFAYNATRFTTTGEFPSARANHDIAELWTPQGSIDPWRDLARLINSQGRPALDTILATAFAAPLVKFSGERGAVIGAWSAKSGVGKSGALETAQAVWGSPARGKSGLSDTDNATFVRAGTLKNVPMYWDEIRGRTADKAVERFGTIIFQLAEGREKARATRSAGLAEQREWQTLLTYAANTSMAEHITEGDKTSPAGAMRVFEFEVMAAEDTFDSNFSQLRAKIANNYGNAGLEYARFLGANAELVNREVTAMVGHLKQRLKSPPDERFWVISIATILLGAKYANRIGLTAFDLAGLKEFLFAEYTRMSSAKASAANDLSTPDNSLAILSQFLGDKRASNTLFTDKISRGGGRQAAGSVRVHEDGPPRDRLGAIEVQIAVVERSIRISVPALTAWLRRNNYTTTQPILDAWEKFFGMQVLIKAALGAGTPLSGGTLRCIEFRGVGYPDIDEAIGRFK